ncbi:MAG TPA: DUF1559 domain-containing protein [Gemmataceae bacterium]|nr:DUF1559 domain-containing protein [Gemmataceae bacterium]
MENRRGFTIVEMLVAIAIVGVMLALLIPAVMRAREAATKTKSMNNLKQCAIAIHHFSDAHNGQCPSLGGAPPNVSESLFFAILPYVEEENYYTGVKAGTLPNSSFHSVKMFLSPADPTIDFAHTENLSSYAANAMCFDRLATYPENFPDGTSNTIGFAEHYAFRRGGTQFCWFFPQAVAFPDGLIAHRASFAEFHASPPGLYGIVPPDIYPVTAGDPPVSTGSAPGLTFQAAPPVSNYDPRLAQTPHRGGMLVAMMDGSVQTLSPGIDATVYWALVTPEGRENFQAPW